jgi:hypothetical protein
LLEEFDQCDTVNGSNGRVKHDLVEEVLTLPRRADEDILLLLAE